jgi:EmrB/QacA subfamily drug resistance transporter
VYDPLTEASFKRTVLFVAAAASFLGPFMISTVNIALPAIGQYFGADAVTLGWVATSYMLATVVALVPVGKAADIAGRRKVFALGAAIVALFNILVLFSINLSFLIICRVFQGIGGAMIVTTSVAILASVFPPGERGKAMGINTAATYLGLSSGPFFGGILVQNFGWKSIFVTAGALGLFVLYTILRHIKTEWVASKEKPFDILGSFLYVIFLLSFMYGVFLIPQIKSLYFILTGMALSIVFFRYQWVASNPVFNVRLFVDNRSFAFSNMAALINYAATASVAFLLSLYLQYVKNMSPQSAGLILVIQPAIQAVFSPYAGRMSDKIEPRFIASAGMALTALGLFLLAILKIDTSMSYLAMALCCLGFGFALFSSPNVNAIMSSVSNEYYGIASSSLATMRLLGQTMSLALATAIFSIMLGKEEVSTANIGIFLKSVNLSFVISTITCIIGIYFSYARGEILSHKASNNSD